MDYYKASLEMCIRDRLWSITRMGEAGAIITTYEAVLYEILRDSKADGFKDISAIVK